MSLEVVTLTEVDFDPDMDFHRSLKYGRICLHFVNRPSHCLLESFVCGYYKYLKMHSYHSVFPCILDSVDLCESFKLILLLSTLCAEDRFFSSNKVFREGERDSLLYSNMCIGKNMSNLGPIIDNYFLKRLEARMARITQRYEEFDHQLTEQPDNYEVWWYYMEFVKAQEAGNHDLIRNAYKLATSNIPDVDNTLKWRGYLILWYNFAQYEEIIVEDIERARQVYVTCLETIPHGAFSFGELAVSYAQFEKRNNNLVKARSLLDEATKRSPCHRVYRRYIDIESDLGEHEKCRKLYREFLEHEPDNCSAWIDFAKSEAEWGTEHKRIVKIFAEARKNIDDIIDLRRLDKAFHTYWDKYGPSKPNSSCSDDDDDE